MSAWSPSIDAYEEYDQRVENWKEYGSDMTVTLRCAWGDKNSLVTDLITNRRPHPENTNLPARLYAESASVKGSAAKYTSSNNDEVLVPTDALVEVNYTRPDIYTNSLIGRIGKGKDPVTGEDITFAEQIEPRMEVIETDTKMFFWATDDKAVDENTPYVVTHWYDAVYTRTVSGLSRLDTNVFTPIAGVNNKDYNSQLLGVLFRKETLLYAPPIASWGLTIQDDADNPIVREGWTLTFNFKHFYKVVGTNFAGWNHIYRKETDTWERLKKRKAGVLTQHDFYPLVDFARWLWNPS